MHPSRDALVRYGAVFGTNVANLVTLIERCTDFLQNALFRAEDPVAGVAQAGDDVGVLVELLVNGG